MCFFDFTFKSSVLVGLNIWHVHVINYIGTGSESKIACNYVCREEARDFFFKTYWMRLWFLEIMIFYWIKPCLFFAESNSPKSLFFYLTAASGFYFFLMNYKPLLHGWFKEPYALNYKKSCSYKQTPKYSSYKAHGDGLANGWFMEDSNPNCKMFSGQLVTNGFKAPQHEHKLLSAASLTFNRMSILPSA